MSKQRKDDHIKLALNSQSKGAPLDIHYEPLLSGHPNQNTDISIRFGDKVLKAPFWVSSMTGGSDKGRAINKNLAKICNKYGLGMGLGSCRSLLDSENRIKDFDFRSIIGAQPFFANIGIAQLEELIDGNQIEKISSVVSKLDACGLIIHVNPLQEWAQPEGDRFKRAPIDTIKFILNNTDLKIIVKEVGQGFGPESLLELMKLQLYAIEFAGYGGTNFTLLEQARHNALASGINSAILTLSQTGHTPQQMCEWAQNNLSVEGIKCKNFIISGGIKNSVEGYILQSMLKAPSVIGFAGALIEHATDESALDEFIAAQVESYKLAKCFLRG